MERGKGEGVAQPSTQAKPPTPGLSTPSLIITPEGTCMAASVPAQPQSPPCPALCGSCPLHTPKPGAFLLRLPTCRACSHLTVPSPWDGPPLHFYTTASCHSGHSPKVPVSDKPSLNSLPRPSLSKALSTCRKKCCAASGPSPTSIPSSGQPSRDPGRVTSSPHGTGLPPHSDPRHP